MYLRAWISSTEMVKLRQVLININLLVETVIIIKLELGIGTYLCLYARSLSVRFAGIISAKVL
ncbi:hypothetical protein [Citrobacter phage Tr1]|nr:hypothetical protein [Citrobacter phage Tr1]